MSSIGSRVSMLALCIVVVACAPARSAETAGDAVSAGDALMAAQRYAEAVQVMRQALDADPENAPLREKLGRAYALSGDPIRAADLLASDADVQVQAAVAELQQGRFSDAERRVTRVLQRDSTNVGALIQRANARAHLSNSGAALYSLADKIGSSLAFENARAELRSGATNDGDAKAGEDFHRAQALPSASLDPQLALANFLWATGRPDESEPLLRAFADQNPGHAAANYALGAYYLSRHRDAEALVYLKNAASIPGEPGRAARFAMVDYYLSNGRDDDAGQMLATMGDDDEQGDVAVRLAQLDWKARKPAEAVRRADDVLARVPGHFAALLLKAQVLFAMGNPDPQYARAAVVASPRSSEAQVLLGQVLASYGDEEGALAAFGEAAKRDPSSATIDVALASLQLELGLTRRAVAVARDAVRLAPDLKEAALLLARALDVDQDHAAADQAFTVLQARWPRDPDVAVAQGEYLARRGNGAAARAAFLRALQEDPDAIDALAGLVSLEVDTGITGDTRQRVARAAAAHPRDPHVIRASGLVRLADGDVDGATASLRRAHDVAPTDAKTAMALADVLGRGGRPGEAADVLGQFLQRRPRAIEARRAMANLLEKSGRLAEAQAAYVRVLQDTPDDVQVISRLGALYLGDPEKRGLAYDLAASAKKRLPKEPVVDALLGRAQTLRGQVSTAIPLLRSAVAARPENATFRYYLGLALWRAGSTAEARQELGRGLWLDPANPEAAEARRLLGASTGQR